MLHNFAQQRRHRRRGEGRLASQHFVKHGSQAINVRGHGHIARFASGLLGRHIGRSAQHRLRQRQAGIGFENLGQSEVGQIRFARLIEQNIARFEVAVEDAALVGMVNRPGDLNHELDSGALSQGLGLELSRQVGPINQPHGKELPAVRLANLIDGSNVRVIQPGGRLCLGLEPLHHARTGQFARRNHLEGHLPVWTPLARAEDNPHPATGNFVEQFIAGELATAKQLRAGSSLFFLFGKGRQSGAKQTGRAEPISRAIAQGCPAFGAKGGRFLGFFLAMHVRSVPDPSDGQSFANRYAASARMRYRISSSTSAGDVTVWATS